MKNLSRIIIFAVVLLSLTVSTVFATDTGLEVEEEFSSPAEMFKAYYNGGVYTRSSEIYLNESNAELQNAFHGPVITDKVTWFNGTELVMNTNSGYGSTGNIENPGWHFKIVNGERVTDYNISSNAGVHFYTLYFFSTSEKCADDKWTQEDGVWFTSDAAIIEAALGFAAPCFTNKTADGDEYLTLSKVSVHKQGDAIVFQLYAEGRVEAIAQTKIVKGVDGTDTIKSLEEFILDPTYPATKN